MPWEDQSWVGRVDWLAQLVNTLLHALFNNVFLVAILVLGVLFVLVGYLRGDLREDKG